MKRMWISLVIVLSLALAACGGGPSVAKVVVSMPLDLEIGEDMLHGAQLAYDETEGQIGNVTVELVTLNSSDPDGSPVSPEQEKKNAEQAITDAAVVAYLGAATSDQARESMRVLNEAGIAQFSSSATWPGLTKPGFGPGEPGLYYPTGRRHFFRLSASDDVQGIAAARWANQLGVQTAYVVDDETAYGRGIAGIFEVSARDLGIEIVQHQTYVGSAATEAALTALSEDIVAQQPDFVFLGSSFGSGGDAFIRVFRGLNQDILVMMPDGMVQDELFAAFGADLVEGIYGTNVTIPADQLDSTAARDFVQRYQAAYGKVPPPYAVNCYESMKVILQAIERADAPTREGVLAAVSERGEVSGVLGEWEFTPAGDISITAISGLQAQDGAWVFVEVIQ